MGIVKNGNSKPIGVLYSWAARNNHIFQDVFGA
jgi:hypothetical protein